MSAKKPQTDHGKAMAAFQGRWITAAEYRACIAGRAWVSGRGIYKWDVWSGRRTMAWFPSRGRVQ